MLARDHWVTGTADGNSRAATAKFRLALQSKKRLPYP